MAKLCDVYVNDAFGTAHRAEATTHGIAKYAPVACAALLAAELDALGKALGNPARPLVAIVAGSKVSTKLTILKSLAGKVDQLIVGGGIANTFMLAAGLSIGKSLAEADLVNEAKAIIDEARERGASVPIPTDVVTAKNSPTAAATVKQVADIEADDMILDIGGYRQGAREPAREGRHDRVERPGRRVRVRPVRQRHQDARRSDRQIVRVLDRGRRRRSRPSRSTASTAGQLHLDGRRRLLEFLEGKKLPAVEVLETRAA